MSSAPRPHPPEAPAARRRLRLLVPVAIALAFLVFRTDALLRVQGPLIADSVEYLLLAHDLLEDRQVPVEPVRNCFFAALVAGQFLLQGLFVDGPFGPASGRVLPILFHVLAVLGAYRLGREIHDRRSGALAALFVAVLPAFGYWATDCLTDVPAAACFVWAVFWWVRGRSCLAGLALGVCVLLRYQAIVCLLAFLGTALLSSERKRLPRALLGLLIIPLGLWILDDLYWGEPFLSFREHFSIFSGHLGGPAPSETVPGGDSSSWLIAMTVGAFSRAVHSQLIVRAPGELTWIVIVLFFAYGVARRWVRKRLAGDTAFAICLASYLLLCCFVYDDLRYLTSLVPVVATVAAAAAVSCFERSAVLIGGDRAARRQTVPLVALSILGAVFCATAWARQAQLRYRPFGAVLDAVEGLVDSGEPAAVGLLQPWIPVHQRAVSVTGAGWWVTDEGARTIDLWYLEQACSEVTRARDVPGRLEEVLRDLDYLVIGGWNPQWEKGSFLWRHLNRRVVLDEVFYDLPENEYAAWRFRVLAPSASDGCFFEILDEAPRAEPVTEFAGGFSLIDVACSFQPGTPRALRIDFTWGIDETATGIHRARVRIVEGGLKNRSPVLHYVLPPRAGDLRGLAKPGSVVRVSRYLEYDPGDTPELTVGVTLLADTAEADAREPKVMRVIRSFVSGKIDEEPLWELLLEITPQEDRRR